MVKLPNFGNPPYGTVGSVTTFCANNKLTARAFDAASETWDDGRPAVDEQASANVSGNHNNTPPGADIPVGGIVGVVVLEHAEEKPERIG